MAAVELGRRAEWATEAAAMGSKLSQDDLPAFQSIHKLAGRVETFAHEHSLLAHSYQGIFQQSGLILGRRRGRRHGGRREGLASDDQVGESDNCRRTHLRTDCIKTKRRDCCNGKGRAEGDNGGKRVLPTYLSLSLSTLLRPKLISTGKLSPHLHLTFVRPRRP